MARPKAARYSVSVPKMTNTMRQDSMLSDRRLIPAVILAGSTASLGGAFAFQYIGGLQPCVLCIWQRWPHGIAIVLAAIALAYVGRRASGWLLLLAGVVLLAGGGIAVFHVGVEQHWWAGTSSCGTTIDFRAGTQALTQALLNAPVVRCDQVAWSLFGISMAGYNALLSLGLGALGVFAGLRRRGEKR